MSSSAKVEEICSPLSNIGINCFRYMRLYKDCSYLLLMNGFSDFLYDSLKNMDDLGNIWGTSIGHVKNGFEPFFLHWPQDGFLKDVNMRLFHKHQVWNGASLIYRYENYIDIVSFALGLSYEDNCGLLINNRDFLKTFTNYFREKASDLLETRDRSNIAVFKNKFDTNYKPNIMLEKAKNFELKLKTQQTQRFKDLNISPRELQCLELLSHGKTAKEIAQNIQISHRTVESYLANLKTRINCNYKSELIEFFFKNQHKMEQQYY
jgi:DNA-binding CsgD family transcriptional regulator